MTRLACLCAIAALGVTAFAQQAPPTSPQSAAPPPQTPQFRSSVDLVHLDVSVLDKNRRPVRGLTPADFTVLENGKPQQVTAFSPVDIPDVPPASAPWMRNIAPDVRHNADLPQRRLFILAIDDATIQNDAAAIKSVKDIARGVIDKLGVADLASVVFTRDNTNGQDFTADRARLLTAVDSFTVGFRGMGDDDLWYMYSIGTLERAVDFLSDVPERRKAIIYIGQGLPFDIAVAGAPVNASPTQATGVVSASMLQIRIKEQMTDVFDRAQRANVTMYTVDACGLRQPPAANPPSARPSAFPPTCVEGLEKDFLINLAAATGGRPVVNTNDFEPGIAGVFQENGSYYLLGYQSSDPTRDGKYRRLDVKVNRPDVEVRTRSGYDAPRDVSSDRPRAVVSPLTKAISGLVPKSDLPMQVTAAPFAVAEKGKPGSVVAIALGFKQPIRQSDERFVENVDLQILAYNADGRQFANSMARADVTIRAGSTGAAEYEVFGRIDLNPGRYQLRVGANVGSLDTAGSIYFDVDVPDFAMAPVSMSGLILSAMPSPPFAPKDAFTDVVPVTPTTRRAFSPTHQVEAFARVYQGAKTKLVPLTVRAQIRNEADELVVDRPLEFTANQFGSTRAADIRVPVPVADLKAGAYVLTISTTLGAATVRRDARFSVVR